MTTTRTTRMNQTVEAKPAVLPPPHHRVVETMWLNPAASADPGGHQVAGPEAVGNEDSDAPRHAEGRNAERRSDAEVGPSSSQAPATFYNSAAAGAGAGGLTTAELSFTGDGEGAQQDEAAAGHELLEEIQGALEGAERTIRSKDRLIKMRAEESSIRDQEVEAVIDAANRAAGEQEARADEATSLAVRVSAEAARVAAEREAVAAENEVLRHRLTQSDAALTQARALNTHLRRRL